MASLDRLESLVLSSQTISHSPEKVMASLDRLESLVLSSQTISHPPEKVMALLDRLESYEITGILGQTLSITLVHNSRDA